VGIVNRGSIEVDRSGRGLCVISVIGEHDVSTASKLDEALSLVLGVGAAVIVDLSATTFIDTMFLSVIVHHARDRGWESAVVSPIGTTPRRVLDYIRADTVLHLYDSCGEAIQAVQIPR
jgi:anti-anti-sigma regulatory factor